MLSFVRLPEEEDSSRTTRSSMFRPPYYFTVLVILVGGSTQFYSYGVLNQVQGTLMEWIAITYKNRGIHLDSSQLNFYWSFVVSSIAVGAIIGALLVKTVAEKLGRRNGLVVNGVVNVFAAFLELLAKPLGSPELLIVGRLIFGANMAINSGIVPIYLMEITPEKYREAVGTLYQVAAAFSELFSLVIGLPELCGTDILWPYAVALPGLFSIILVSALPFCFESPKYLLIVRQRPKEAKEVLLKLVREQEAMEMMESLQEENQDHTEGTGTLKELLRRRDLRRPLIISLIVILSQQFTGCTSVFAFSTEMFLNANIASDVARFSTVILGISYFLSTLCAPFLIRRLGKKRLALFQLSMVSTAMLLMVIFTYLQITGHYLWAGHATIFALVLYMCVFGVGSPIPWMITSELFDTKFRSTAVTLGCTFIWSLAFIISTLYLPFKELVGISASFLPFVVFSGFFAVILYFLLPQDSKTHS